MSADRDTSVALRSKLLRISDAIYIAVEESVAADISGACHAAVEQLDHVTQRAEHAEQQCAASTAKIEDLEAEVYAVREASMEWRETVQRERDRAQAIVHAARIGLPLSYGMYLVEGKPDVAAIAADARKRGATSMAEEPTLARYAQDYAKALLAQVTQERDDLKTRDHNHEQCIEQMEADFSEALEQALNRAEHAEAQCAALRAALEAAYEILEGLRLSVVWELAPSMMAAIRDLTPKIERALLTAPQEPT